MNVWNRAGIEMMRVFFAQNQHIVIVIGKKPKRCAEIKLIDHTRDPKVPILSVQCNCENEGEHTDTRCLDTYCLVRPVLAGKMRPFVTFIHGEGSELVKVEMLPSFLAPEQSTGRATEVEVASLDETLNTAIGFSQNYSMDEAFNDALKKLRLIPEREGACNPTFVDVVSMGAVYGGVAGFSRLFVKVEQSAVLDMQESGPTKIASQRESSEPRNCMQRRS